MARKIRRGGEPIEWDGAGRQKLKVMREQRDQENEGNRHSYEIEQDGSHGFSFTYT